MKKPRKRESGAERTVKRKKEGKNGHWKKRNKNWETESFRSDTAFSMLLKVQEERGRKGTKKKPKGKIIPFKRGEDQDKRAGRVVNK